MKVVSPSFLEERGLEAWDEALKRRSGRGETVVYLLVDGEAVGGISLADVVRPESREAVDRLREMGLSVMMLTGDSGDVARWVAEDLGLDEYFSEVLPDEKAARVEEVRERGVSVAMTGDGVNDAPALVEADVGIAIGAGTDVAIESADVVLVESDPRDVAAVVTLSRATYNKMVQNLFWATGYNAFAIPLAAGVLYGQGFLISPAVGALLISLSTVVVAVNARRLGGVQESLPG